MILSHEHKFIFIKGMKVASTSAEIALSQICGPHDIITPITRADELYRLGTAGEPRNYASHFYPRALGRYLEGRLIERIKSAQLHQLEALRGPRPRFVNHMDLRAVQRMVPQARDYEVLCVERSPYAKVMSLANWVQHHQTYGKGRALPTDTRSLAAAVDRLLDDRTIARVRNLDRYRDVDGRVTVRPWRSESLSQDIAKFFRSRGVEPVQLVNAKRGANSDAINPSTVLREDQIAAINLIFKEEFDLFGWPMIG